jgi:ribosomal protein S27AE
VTRVECIVCDDGTQMAPELRPGRWHCPQCGSTLLVPREVGVETGNRPYRVRQNIIERLPWHTHGIPVVKVKRGRR